MDGDLLRRIKHDVRRAKTAAKRAKIAAQRAKAAAERAKTAAAQLTEPTETQMEAGRAHGEESG